jgi:large subunit ribosomal protein L18
MRATYIKNMRRDRRALAVRSRLRQNSSLPRLSVARSLKHISAQIIDDASGRTLAAVTSTAKALAPQLSGKTKSERAAIVGAELARKALEAGVQAVVFDRGFMRFHGRVKALAEAARQGGLKF